MTRLDDFEAYRSRMNDRIVKPVSLQQLNAMLVNGCQ